MRNLLLFFIKYNAFFIFLLLEMISGYFIIQERFNKKHHQVFMSSSNQVVAFVKERSYRIKRYWQLPSVNDSLVKENARLLEQLRSAYFYHDVHQDSVMDTLKQVRYKYIEAEVIDNSTSRLNNFLTINRGSKHGVRPGMGVTNGMGTGVVGVVKTVSANFATIMSVLHVDTRISAKIKRNGYFGIVRWEGTNPNYVVMDAVPRHAQIVKGDTVITSGYSGIYPKDIQIGIVESFSLDPGSNFYDMKIRLSCDMSNVQYAFVVEDMMKPEIDNLQKTTINE